MTVTGSPNPTRAFETTLVPIDTARKDSSFYGPTSIGSGASRSVSLGVGSSAWSVAGVVGLVLAGGSGVYLG